MSKESSHVVTLSATQLVAIRRNVEKFIGTVIPPQQLGTFLQELVEGRFDVDVVWRNEYGVLYEHKKGTSAHSPPNGLDVLSSETENHHIPYHEPVINVIL